MVGGQRLHQTRIASLRIAEGQPRMAFQHPADKRGRAEGILVARHLDDAGKAVFVADFVNGKAGGVGFEGPDQRTHGDGRHGMFLLKWQRTQVSFFPPPSSSGRLPGRKKKRNKDKEPLSPRRRTAARHPFPCGGRRAHRESGKMRTKGRRSLSLTPGLRAISPSFPAHPGEAKGGDGDRKRPGPVPHRALPPGRTIQKNRERRRSRFL